MNCMKNLIKVWPSPLDVYLFYYTPSNSPNTPISFPSGRSIIFKTILPMLVRGEYDSNTQIFVF